MGESQRADARRNYARILAVAQEEVAAQGAGASLEKIARVAGVGSATVRRHFPTRRALLEAVHREQLETLCTRARELTDQGGCHPDSRSSSQGDSRSGGRGDSRSGGRGDSRSGGRGGSQSDNRSGSRSGGQGDSRTALLGWLGDVVAYSVSARGLADALAYDGPVHENGCSAALEAAADPLLRRAVQDGAVAADVTVADLITLVVGIVLATEQHPDPAASADRLFRLAVAGLSPCR